MVAMTYREAAIIMAYTGVVMLQGEELKYYYDYLQELMDEPVYTHQLAEDECADEIKARSQLDFTELCRRIRDNNNKDFPCKKCVYTSSGEPCFFGKDRMCLPLYEYYNLF